MAKSKPVTKKMRGRSGVQNATPLYKPTIYLGNGNIPRALRDLKPGESVSFNVTGRVIRRSEEAKGVSDVVVEIGRIAPRAK